MNVRGMTTDTVSITEDRYSKHFKKDPSAGLYTLRKVECILE